MGCVDVNRKCLGLGIDETNEEWTELGSYGMFGGVHDDCGMVLLIARATFLRV